MYSPASAAAIATATVRLFTSDTDKGGLACAPSSHAASGVPREVTAARGRDRLERKLPDLHPLCASGPAGLRVRSPVWPPALGGRPPRARAIALGWWSASRPAQVPGLSPARRAVRCARSASSAAARPRTCRRRSRELGFADLDVALRSLVRAVLLQRGLEELERVLV